MDPKDNYRGMSYGDWVARWTNWLFSPDPDRSEIQGDVVFLRGNVEYSAALQKAKAFNPLFDPWNSFYNRTGEAGLLISDVSCILVPVITSTYLLGAESRYGILNTEEQVRNVTRIDNDQSGGIWATIESNIAAGSTATLGATAATHRELTYFRVTSRMFKLSISEVNPFWKGIFEYAPLSSGEYDAVTDGFFLLLKAEGLPEGSHRIRFGGKGRLEYRTDSIYDLYVDSKFRPASSVVDLSISKPVKGSVWFPKGSTGAPDRVTGKPSQIDPLRNYP